MQAKSSVKAAKIKQPCRNVTLPMQVEICIPAVFVIVQFRCSIFYLSFCANDYFMSCVFFCFVPLLSLYFHLSPYGGDRCPLSCQGDRFTLAYLQVHSNTKQPKCTCIIHPHHYTKPTFRVFVSLNHSGFCFIAL